MKNSINKPLGHTENSVLNEYAKRLQVTPMQIVNHNKSSEISDIRQLYCKLRHDCHGVSYSAIGREIGRGHTTVKCGVMRINDMLAINDNKIVALWSRVKDILAHYV